MGCHVRVLGATLVLVVLLLLVFRPSLFYRAATRLIVVSDRLVVPGDFIYVLNGRVDPRAEHTAQLYLDHAAPKVVVPHTREMARRPDRPLSEVVAEEIAARGVPADSIRIAPFEGGVTDTRDEARALRRYLEANPATRVIVVTMDYHTGRARRALRQEVRGLNVDILMSGAPHVPAIGPDNWWESEEGRQIYLTELVKQLATILRLDAID